MLLRIMSGRTSGERALESSTKRREAVLRAAVAETLEPRRLLASIIVNSDADNTTPGDSLVTLREAIIAANNDTTTDTGETGSGDDTITFNLSAGAHTIQLAGALPDLNSNIVLQGPGSSILTVRRNSGGNYRIFTIAAGRTVSVSGMTITNGLSSAPGGGILVNGANAALDDCVFKANIGQFGGGVATNPNSVCVATNCAFTSNSTSPNDGGGFDNFGSLATLDHCTFTGNISRFAGAVLNSSSTLIVSDSTFDSNTSTSGGGAIENFRSSALIRFTSTSVDGSTFLNNKVTNNNFGGGILNQSNTQMTVSDSTFTGNSAGHGGAIANATNANLTVTDSVLATNTATLGSGGIDNNGFVNLQGSTLAGNHSDNGGGAIWNNAGSFSVDQSVLTGNTAVNGAAIQNLSSLSVSDSTFGGNIASNVGGGINSSNSLNISGCLFAGNVAGFSGAAIHNTGFLFANTTTYTDNSAQGNGGGIYNGNYASLYACNMIGNSANDLGGAAILNDSGAVLYVSSCTLSGNTGSNGSAIMNFGNATVDTCTLDGNHVVNSGAAIYNDDPGTVAISNSTLSNNVAANGIGGGIYNGNNSTCTLINTTLSGNAATHNLGGGICNASGGTLSIDLSTVSGNSATDGGGIFNLGSFTAANSIISLNSGGDVGTFGGTFDLSDHDFVGGDPMLGPLSDNGGPTLTMALLPGSPCINAGNPNYFGSSLDQRGFPRVYPWRVDIGAFEYQGVFNESLVVTTTSDEDDGTSDPAFGTGTSLREAIHYADFQGGGPNLITFNLGDGAHTINLSGPLPHLAADVTIQGPGADLLTVRRDTGGDYSIFTIDFGVVSLSGMTITNGSSFEGGGVDNFGELTVTDCAITGDTAVYDGGGISDFNTLTVRRCTVSGNTVTDPDFSQGAGICEFGVALSISDSTISDNHAPFARPGGGIFNSGFFGGATITNCTISNNSAGQGAGIYNGAVLTVQNSTISGNTSDQNQSAIATANELHLLNCTVADNPAGAGIELDSGLVEVSLCTITGNAGGGINNLSLSNTVLLNNSIVALNQSALPAVNTPYTGAFNFIGDENPGVDPLLAPLADNGGPTQTIRLLPGSPCINAGDPTFASPPDFDQRGEPFTRVVGGRIDIGAYEARNTASTAAANPLTVPEDGSGSIHLMGLDAETLPAQLTFTILSLPTRGVLSLGGVPVTVGQHILGSPANLKYESGVVLDGPGSDTFKFQVTDTGYAPLPALTSPIATAHISIAKAVNDGTYSFDPVGGIVRVGGTAAADDILLDKAAGNKLRIRIGHSTYNTPILITSLHDIRIWGRGGNDHVHFGGGFDGLSLFVHGGAGDDSIEQDHMASVLIGGDGKDKLTAGDRNDVLIGSAGADNLNAGKGNDMLIGGLPSPKLTLTALRQAGSAWASTHTSQLTKIAPVQDTEADTFTGGSGLDWFVENLADKITDLQATKDLVTKV